MMMPTGERRFFLSLLIKNKTQEQERMKETTKSTGKGKRSSTISGEALKSKIKTGEIPMT
jgi:hypothetical protein